MNRLFSLCRVARLAEKSSLLSLPRQRLLISPVSQQSSRNYSQEKAKTEDPKEKAKMRRAYALGGCLMFMWLSTHGILLYRRRSDHRELDEKMPPIPWDEFVEKYLATGQVKSIVFQPQFGTGNVYVHSENEQKMKKTVADMFHISPPDKFSRPPDVRFFFGGDQKQVEKAILDVQKEASKGDVPVREVEFSVDQFPSYRELSFIVASTLFTLAAVTLMK